MGRWPVKHGRPQAGKAPRSRVRDATATATAYQPQCCRVVLATPRGWDGDAEVTQVLETTRAFMGWPLRELAKKGSRHPLIYLTGSAGEKKAGLIWRTRWAEPVNLMLPQWRKFPSQDKALKARDADLLKGGVALGVVVHRLDGVDRKPLAVGRMLQRAGVPVHFWAVDAGGRLSWTFDVQPPPVIPVQRSEHQFETDPSREAR